MTGLYVVSNVSKSFGRIPVLTDVNFEVMRGQVNGLVGANGAGKSTLLKILIGAVRADQGQFAIDGRPIEIASVKEAAAAGVVMVTQELSLFPALSVEENLLLAPGGAPWRARRAYSKRAVAALDKLGVRASLSVPLHRLSLADRQLVEIARALLQQPRVLILDEPTSSLHAAEVERLHGVIRELRDDGLGIVYVSHFLEELLEISDCLTILRNGRRVSDDISPSSAALQRVVASMLGRGEQYESREPPSLREIARSTSTAAMSRHSPLTITNLKGPTNLRIDHLTARPGEIAGLVGLSGAGVEELLAILFGRAKPRSGKVRLPSGGLLPGSTAGAIRAGVAYAPADRKAVGLMLRQSVAENVVSVRSLVLKRDGVLLDARKATEIAARRRETLKITCASLEQPVGELSGGNQQKVVFAKWIEAGPSLLILDDPTRGVDVGAREEMHALIRAMVEGGMVVLFSSSDPGEIASVCDRVHVFVNGALTGELSGDGLSEQAIVSGINTNAATSHANGASGLQIAR